MLYHVWHKRDNAKSWTRYGQVPYDWESCMTFCREVFWKKGHIAEIFEEDDHPNTDTIYYLANHMPGTMVNRFFTKEDTKLFILNNPSKESYYIKSADKFYIKQ